MALDPLKLTQGISARTAPSIVIKATDPDGKIRTIGAVKKMDRRISRNMTRRRELDSNIPGATVEIVPGAVSTFEISIDRAMLNSSTMLEGFGIAGIEDLISQNIPIDVEEHRFLPNGDEQIVTYRTCFFKDNPQSIDIDSDWIIIQSATLEVTTADVQDPS